jgi:Curli production assembly/transport component CsgG/Glucodextranase, domain B
MPRYPLRVFIVSLVLVAVTTPVITRAEESSGTWRGKWWNYYERALSKGENSDWEAARNDLTKAIGLRNTDQRRARTYGMHFTDYFPHRELGVACFQLGDLTKALTELEISYKSEESAKAAFYLNKVRSALLRQQGAQSKAPEIHVSSPMPGQAFKEAVITVSGHVAADGYVAAVRINGKPYRYDLARNGMDFTMDVQVDDDDDRIVIEATDLMGTTSRKEISVSIDREGPSLSLSAIARSPEDSTRVHINALLTDATGIRELLVNGVSVATGSAREMTLNTTVTLATGTSTVRIEATDLLGNQTSAEFNPDHERAALLRRDPPVLVALNGPGIFTSDREPPVISLKDVEDLPSVFIDRYYVEGDAFDNVKVDRITVNGKEIQIAKGKKVFFSKMLKLKEGSNRIIVEATDSSGNRKAAEFNIKRIVPAARQAAARMSLSVLPFSGKIKNNSIQEMADDFLVAALVDQKRFQIVEREKLKQILQEQKLAKEKLTDPEHSLQIGKLISADAMLATTVSEGQRSVEIVSRLVNTETAEVMETKDAYIEDKSLAAVKELMEGLASKLTLGFPVVEGMVVKRDKGTVFSDIGRASGVRGGMGAAIYRRGKEIKHPVTGKSLGWDMVKIGDGTFEEVEDGFSKVRLHDKARQPQDIQAKDVIITR